MSHLSVVVDRFMRALEELKEKYNIVESDLNDVKFRLSCIIEWMYNFPHEADDDEIKKLQKYLEGARKVDTSRRLGDEN